MTDEFEFYMRQCLERCREQNEIARKNLEMRATTAPVVSLLGLIMEIQSSAHEELVLLRVLQKHQNRIKETTR